MRRELTLAKPTRAQQQWHDLDRGMFFHFNMSTFVPTYDPWERPPEDPPAPENFDPDSVEIDQWLEAASAFGANYAVLTAKHHEGFCLWPTEAHDYDVTVSPWGEDLVAAFVEACADNDIQPGLYLSGWSTYTGTTPGGTVADWSEYSQSTYNDLFLTQLEELLTEYGDLLEIWFDGSIDPEEGPDVRSLIYDHQPDAIVFQSPAGSIRWVGNERGYAPDPFWNPISVDRARAVESGNAFDDRDQGDVHGDADGNVWLPGECDTTLRDHHWFWKPDTASTRKSVDELVEVYYRSVGRGCNLLLNANPDRTGNVPAGDLERYRQVAEQIDGLFDDPVATAETRHGTVELSLGGQHTIDHVVLAEAIRDGQRVEAYRLEARTGGSWETIATGTTVGHRRIDRFDPVTADAIRFHPLETVARPIRIKEISAYNVDGH